MFLKSTVKFGYSPILQRGWNVRVIKPFAFILQAGRGCKGGVKKNFIQLLCRLLSEDS